MRHTRPMWQAVRRYTGRKEHALETVRSAEEAHAVVAAVSGAPVAVQQRQVRVFQPGKSAMQTGAAGNMTWRLEFDVQRKWQNPLMGWTSS